MDDFDIHLESISGLVQDSIWAVHKDDPDNLQRTLKLIREEIDILDELFKNTYV